MPICKKCGSNENIKSGKVNQKQRYECKKCGCHFIEGDERTNEKIKAKKALCVLFYSLGKSSFRMLAKIFNTHPSLVYRWVVEASNKLPAYQINETITEIEFDEMWHFVKSKKTSYGLLKLLTEEQEKQLHGYLESVIQIHLKDYTIK